MSSSSLLSTWSPDCRFPIPKTYKFLKILGEGAYGTVIKCVKQKTGEVVAVKVNKHSHRSQQWEAFMMRTLMAQNMDNYNIIRYEGEIVAKWRLSLMYEMLDFSLQDYLADLQKPMRLENIRVIIQQMAVAFDALQTVNVIHTDVKIDNIMLVDHVKQPFRVKLIDFGLAIFRWQVRLQTVIQAPSIAAPEVIIGLPVSEAIDIWSLGCALGIMISGVKLFPGNVYREVLPHMTNLLGPPPAHLLNAGVKSDRFFKETNSDSWQLKEPDEYAPFHFRSNKKYGFHSLDEMKMVHLEVDNPMEVEERRECIELLKAMLRWDPKERITPCGILNHPFITKRYLNSSSQNKNCNEQKPSTSQSKTSHLEEKPKRVLRCVIRVRPVNNLKKTSERDSETTLYHTASPGSSSDTTNSQMEKGSPRFTCDENHLPEDSTDEKKKKRKNCFKHFFSWTKKKFGANCCVDVLVV